MEINPTLQEVSASATNPMRFPMLLLSLFFQLSCSFDNQVVIQEKELRNEVLISNPVFTVSYNEELEQPNWVEYVVKNRPKIVDRGSMDFYKESKIHTSDDSDYYKNEWDKGHLAPAASFSDSYERLKMTFSYLNCALQYDDLNRGEWAQLESMEREWSKTYGDIKVRVELIFSDGHIVLPTGAHVPTGFVKQIEFPQDSIVCYYFINDSPKTTWENSDIDCP